MKEQAKELVPSDPHGITNKGPITLNPVDLNNATDWEDFISLWMVSKEIDMRNQWFKGDIANRVAIAHGEGSLRQFAQDVQEKGSTVESYRRVARAFPNDMRNLNISWTHYFLASYTDSYNKGEKKFDSEERYKWVEKANDGGWSTVRMSQEIKKEHALIENDNDIFAYYNDYLSKVNNILTHIEKNNISKQQGDMLLDKILEIHENLANYLDGKKWL